MYYRIDYYDAFNGELEAEYGPFATLDEVIACVRSHLQRDFLAMDAGNTHCVIDIGPDGPVTRTSVVFDAEARLEHWTHFGQRPAVVASGPVPEIVDIGIDALAAEVCAAIATERRAAGEG